MKWVWHAKEPGHKEKKIVLPINRNTTAFHLPFSEGLNLAFPSRYMSIPKACFLHIITIPLYGLLITAPTTASHADRTWQGCALHPPITGAASQRSRCCRKMTGIVHNRKRFFCSWNVSNFFRVVSFKVSLTGVSHLLQLLCCKACDDSSNFVARQLQIIGYRKWCDHCKRQIRRFHWWQEAIREQCTRKTSGENIKEQKTAAAHINASCNADKK